MNEPALSKLEVARRMIGKTIYFSNKEGNFMGTITEVKNDHTFIAELVDRIKCEVDLFDIKEVR
jgi:hypothetical protein